MGLRDDLQADLTAAVADYDDSFEWDGQRYPCVRSRPLGHFKMLPAGGFINGAEGSLVVVKNAVPIANPRAPGLSSAHWPKEGDMIDGERFQIVNIDGREQHSCPHLVIHFGPPDGGSGE